MTYTPVEAWRCLGEMTIEWRKGVLVLIFENKGCIKLISHSMRLWERVEETRLRGEAMINEQQYGSMPGKRTTNAMSAWRILMENYREGQKETHCVFCGI